MPKYIVEIEEAGFNQKKEILARNEEEAKEIVLAKRPNAKVLSVSTFVEPEVPKSTVEKPKFFNKVSDEEADKKIAERNGHEYKEKNKIVFNAGETRKLTNKEKVFLMLSLISVAICLNIIIGVIMILSNIEEEDSVLSLIVEEVSWIVPVSVFYLILILSYAIFVLVLLGSLLSKTKITNSSKSFITANNTFFGIGLFIIFFISVGKQVNEELKVLPLTNYCFIGFVIACIISYALIFCLDSTFEEDK